MEVSGIDPEIVAGQQASQPAHQAAQTAQQVAQAATGAGGPGGSDVSPKNELDAAHDADGAAGSSVNGGVAGGSGSSASQASSAAALAANQYAAAAAYGPPVPVQPTSASQPVETHARVGKRRVRLGWTEEETRNLMEGCKRHGVGNWKKILTDPSFRFNCRTAVDLKDRFRTSFPEEYSRLYPNARTHKVKRLSSSGGMPSLIKVSRKERRAFTPDEDERLLQGFLKHGPAWSKIQRDQTLGLADRRSTDLRDRFRNAFPDRYTAAGYKGRSSGGKATTGASAAAAAAAASNNANGGSDMQIGGALDDELSQQHGGVMAGGRYIPNAQMLQQMQYQQQYPQAAQYGQNQRPSQQYGQQTQQQYQQYQQPMFYGMGMNAQMPMQMATSLNQIGQMTPQMNTQMRQVPQMNMGQMGVWQNQQQ